MSPVRRRRVTPFAGLLVVVPLALAGCSGTHAVDQAGNNPAAFVAGDGTVKTTPVSERRAVTGLAGHTLDGKQRAVADWHGDVVVVNFWASWCGPCRSEVDGLEAVAQQTSALGVRFLGIDFKDDAANARAFVRRHDVTYPSIYDQPGRLGLQFHPSPAAIPTTLILDRQHREAVRISGPVRFTTLLSLVQRVAAEQAA